MMTLTIFVVMSHNASTSPSDSKRYIQPLLNIAAISWFGKDVTVLVDSIDPKPSYTLR